MKQKQTQRHREQICGCLVGRGGKDREFGIDMYTLHYLKWITNNVKSLSRVQLFATPWTVAYQAPLSMGFSRQ